MHIRLLFAVCVLAAPALRAQAVQAPYVFNYTLLDLGQPAGVPGNYGGVAFKIGEPDLLYLGGQATRSTAAVYQVPVTRDGAGHITGFAAPALRYADAPDLDGGLRFGPGNVLFFTRYNQNELGQIAPGSTTMTKSVPLTPLGVLPSVGGLSFIPAGLPRAGDVMLSSYTRAILYTAALVPDGSGTYDVSPATQGPTIGGGPEGLLHVPPDSPHFANFEWMIVCEFARQEIAAYHLDANGDPEPASRQVFVNGFPGVQGVAIDPASGDLVFSSYGGNRLLVVQGFGVPCGQVLHYGQATAGTGGIVPTLDSRGCFARRETVSLDVSDGLGGAFGVMWAGLQRQDLPVLGVRILVNPILSINHVLSGAPGAPGMGTFSLPFPIPDRTILLGTNFDFQAVYLDPGAPFSLSATDGIELNVR